MKRIAVIVMDAQAGVREGLRSVLEAEADIQVAGEAGTVREARRLAQTHRPEVVVVGSAVPLIHGLALARRIVQRAGTAKVLLLVSHGPRGRRLLSSRPWQSLRRLIERSVSRAAEASSRPGQPGPRRGGRTAGPEASRSRGERSHGGLTSREVQVLQAIANGMSNKQIAAELALSIKTVEKHRQQLMDKLNIHGIAGLTRYAILRGLLE